MTRLWNDLEGSALAGRYVLEQCLSATEDDAWYLTRTDDGRQAAMRVTPEDGERLALWREAAGADHPHLVRIFEAGRTEINGSPLIYCVCEFPDDFLAGVLGERPLSPAEAREVLRASLGALRYLHGRGLVHSGVDPTHIMAFGDRIKLPSDTWELPSEDGGKRRIGPYDAPECARGALMPASDIWSLAVTLHEVLTQQRPNLEHDSEFRYLAEPFATILRHSLLRDPDKRWTVEDIERHMHPPAPPPPIKEPVRPAAPVRPPVAAKPVEPPKPKPAVKPLSLPPRPAPPVAPAPSPRALPIRWVPVAGLVAATALGLYFLRQDEPRRAAPPPEPVASAPAPTPAAPPPAMSQGRPSALEPPQAAARSEDIRWRVIAYTYNSRKPAEQKVESINEKHPHLQPEVFALHPDRGPFFISLGGRMTRGEAREVQKQAIARGMPRDTFVRNFTR